MKDLTHNYERFGCKIDADLENTVAVLTDPDGEQQEFVSDKEHNALWHALQAAKSDQKQRGEKAAAKAMEQVKADESDEPTDIDITDVEHVDGANEL
jgi:hypothetical protein